MNKYELMVMYWASLSESEVKKHISQLHEQVKKQNGKVVKEDYWGLKDLAYEMLKQTQAYYHLVEMEFSSDQVAKLVTWLKRQEDSVLRHLLVKI